MLLVEFVTETQILEGVSVWNKFRDSPSPIRDKMKELERVFYWISFDPCLSMPTGYNQVVYCNSRILIRDSLERRFIR